MFTITIKRINPKHPLPNNDVFPIVSTERMMFPPDRAVEYATGLQFNFLDTLQMRVENAKQGLLILSHYLNTNNELILILMNIYHAVGGLDVIEENETLAIVSFYEHENASIRFIEMSDKGR